jgi:ATP-dependent RNA helicase DeaD
MLTFKELGLSPKVLQSIEALGYSNPTPIQEQIIPTFLGTQNDLIGLAQT